MNDHNEIVAMIRPVLATHLAMFEKQSKLLESIRACLKGNVCAVCAGLDSGADANQGCDGISPVFAAVCNGHINFVDMLIEQGACVDAFTQTGHTPLTSVISMGNVSMAKA